MAWSGARACVVDAVDWCVHGGIAWSGAAGSQVTEVWVPDRRLDGIPHNLSSALKRAGAVAMGAFGTVFEGQLITQLILKLINAILHP